jgi:hypothetical protein
MKLGSESLRGDSLGIWNTRQSEYRQTLLRASKPMAVRPRIRPRPRVTAPTVVTTANSESLEGLPRVLSRVCECPGESQQSGAHVAPRQTVVIAKPQVLKPSPVKPKIESEPDAEQILATKPSLPAYWQSRKVLVAAGIAVIATAVAVGYQFRPKQQIIVVHPAKQPSALAAAPANNSDPASAKPTFQPLSPATTPAPVSAKETTSTASLMPRATWPAEKPFTAAPLKSPLPAVPATQTATKPVDTRTSLNRAPNFPVVQENLPLMSSQFPQAPSSGGNPLVVYNPTLNAGQSPLASGGSPQNNLPPQHAASPMYTAARPNIAPGQQQTPQDGSFGAYGGAHFEGQIQPLPLRR